MLAADDLLILITDNLKMLFFPEEWLNLDMKFSKSELMTLLLVDKKGEITMTELAETIGAPMSTATGLADRLVKAGYLKRERSDSDRRIVVLRAGEKGSAIAKDFKGILSQYLSVLSDALTEEEKQQLMAIVLKIFHALQARKEAVQTSTQEKPAVRSIPIE